ncbi:hypothetical protein C0993_007527, partial [Termitomyces sp. T159_Od127]
RLDDEPARGGRRRGCRRGRGQKHVFGPFAVVVGGTREERIAVDRDVQRREAADEGAGLGGGGVVCGFGVREWYRAWRGRRGGEHRGGGRGGGGGRGDEAGRGVCDERAAFFLAAAVARLSARERLWDGVAGVGGGDVFDFLEPLGFGGPDVVLQLHARAHGPRLEYGGNLEVDRDAGLGVGVVGVWLGVHGEERGRGRRAGFAVVVEDDGGRHGVVVCVVKVGRGCRLGRLGRCRWGCGGGGAAFGGWAGETAFALAVPGARLGRGEAGHRGRYLDLFDDDDAGADLAGHHLEGLEALFELCTRKADEGARVGDTELVVGLSAALEEAPLELGDEAGEAGGGRGEQLELVLDVAVVVLGDEAGQVVEGQRLGRRGDETVPGTRNTRAFRFRLSKHILFEVSSQLWW